MLLFNAAFPTTNFTVNQLCNLWWRLGLEAKEMTAEVQMNPATEWAWECWAEAMSKNPYVQQFVLNGGPFVVHAASCPEELAAIEYEMAAAFVTAGRGQ